MNRSVTKTLARMLLVAVVAAGGGAGSLHAQHGGMVISSEPDFSTSDRVFSRDDVLYVRVAAPQIDYTDLKKNRLWLKPRRGGQHVREHFVNHFDGTYTAALPLGATDPSVTQWELRVDLASKGGRKFKSRVRLRIEGHGGGRVVAVGPITALSDHGLEVDETFFHVTRRTRLFVRLGTYRDDLDPDLAWTHLPPPGECRVWYVDRPAAQQPRPVSCRRIVGERFRDAVVVTPRGVYEADDWAALDGDDDDAWEDDDDAWDDDDDGWDDDDDWWDDDDDAWDDDDDAWDDDDDGGRDRRGVGLLLPIQYRDLRLGMIARVEGVVDGNGDVVARRVVVRAPGDEVVVRGTITDLDHDGELRGLTVGRTFFRVEDETDIVDEHGDPFAFEDLARGMFVVVRGHEDDEGRLVAHRVEVGGDASPGGEEMLVVTAEVEDVDLDARTVTLGGFTFEVDGRTVVLDTRERRITLEELPVGAVAQVRARIRSDGTMLAERIEQQDDEGDVELVGRIDEVAPGRLVVAGVEVYPDDDTEVVDEQGDEMSLGDLRTGMLVDVVGVLGEDGRLVAHRIEVRERLEDEVVVEGVVEDVDGDGLVVLGRRFRVLGATQVLDEDGEAISLGDLAAGETVRVRADLQPGGALVAFRVQRKETGASAIYVAGPVESVGTNTLEVIGIHFFVDAATEVVDEAGEPLSLAALEVGDAVAVEAAGQPDGTRLAERIQRQDVSLVSGAIASMEQGRLTVAGATYRLDASTVVLGFGRVVLGRGALARGLRAEVHSVAGAGERVATKVELIAAQAPGTGVAEADVPARFVLHSNYPNPFNPATTIAFDVRPAAEGPVRTRLAVYNVLGQELRVLVDAVLPAGTYRYTWDGSDRHRRTVASGVYLYRLQVGGEVQTRSMTLVK